MNKIKNCIPKRCTLGGVEFTTRFHDDPSHASTYGEIEYPTGDIRIEATIRGLKQAHTQIQNTYFHELAHGIFMSIGRDDLRQDEVLVQGVGNMIFEFLRTCDWIRIEELKHNNESEATFSFQTLNQSQLK